MAKIYWQHHSNPNQLNQILKPSDMLKMKNVSTFLLFERHHGWQFGLGVGYMKGNVSAEREIRQIRIKSIPVLHEY